jgi:RNA polymerase sigma-70 factor (ECF subfamily)
VEIQSFDIDYVARLTRGDIPTERHFTAYFRELLLLKLRSRLRAPDLIEDVIQETFVRVIAALRRNEGLNHPERLGAFVNSVSNNVLHEFLRSRSRAAPISAAVEPAAAGPTIESTLVSRERQELVSRILRDLPERDYGLLRGVFLEEKDKDVVCAEYGVDREYLRVLLHRAVEKARKLMRAQYFAARA